MSFLIFTSRSQVVDPTLAARWIVPGSKEDSAYGMERKRDSMEETPTPGDGRMIDDMRRMHPHPYERDEHDPCHVRDPSDDGV